jgi:tRNA dimethylallyltransferase
MPPKVVVVMGTTGIGKSSIARALCRRLNGELLSLDSVKLHRGLTIGAHKVYDPVHPVHLYDLVEPDKHFSVQEYLEAATDATEKVLRRGRVPIFFGGANMYAEWMFFGGGENAPVDKDEVAEVEAELRACNDWEKAYETAAELDPIGAGKILPNDYYRLSRLVCASRANAAPFSGVSGYKKPRLELDLRGAFLFTPNRLALYRSLDRRCEKMLADGLLEETLLLMHRFGGELPRKISTVVGYRQCQDFLKANPGIISEEAFLGFLQSFQAVTRNYARRQMTYFRHSRALSSHFCVLTCLPTDESAQETVGELERLHAMTRAEYDSDERRKSGIPVVANRNHHEGMRLYRSTQECFGDPNMMRRLLERLYSVRASLTPSASPNVGRRSAERKSLAMMH